MELTKSTKVFIHGFDVSMVLGVYEGESTLGECIDTINGLPKRKRMGVMFNVSTLDERKLIFSYYGGTVMVEEDFDSKMVKALIGV